jgi:acid stress-induced BolA-like protein IbaG/YrbA
MSEVVVAPEAFDQRLELALRQGLEQLGIQAEVETEPVRTTRLYRAMVTSPQWEELGYMDRQEVVWRILDRYFTRDEQLHVASVTTLTPDEVEGR